MSIHRTVADETVKPYCHVPPSDMARAMGEFGLRRCPMGRVQEALSLGEDLIAGSLSRPEVVSTVDAITGMTIWVVETDSQLNGVYLIVPLTEEGRAAVESGDFNPADPALRHLAPAGTAIFGLYIGIYAGSTKDARRSIMAASANVRVSRFSPVPVFARAATEDGARSMLSLGFRPLEGGLPDLFVSDPLNG
ncbi:hypothetical protein [Henriciella litoralis]|uniref:hypothetical protein n=1 Tax=Henriciella litoralis TaxID=568102 RepID=UPI00111C4130|nr:hypothetical protein [Henriciella litoralis]